MPEPASAHRPWLHGPASDLLLGCGGLFSIVFVAFAWAGPDFFGALPLAVPALLVYLVGMPHYGATLVRVYDHRDDRRAYALFSVGATLGLAGLFGAGLAYPALASLLFTLYLSWSPWHYAAQNYGIAMMFARRRGVPLPGAAKRALHLSFFLSFLLVLVLLHLEDAAPAAGLRDVHLVPVGIPAAWGTELFAAILALYLACLVAYLAMALRAAPLRDLGPSLAIVFTQILWHSLPIAISAFHVETGLVPLDREQRAEFFTWIAAGHGAQYLWITSYYARSAADWRGTWRYYAKVLAAGTAIWTIPAVVLAPSRLGVASFSGFFLLLAAVVNLHHFVLDGAIWKLRNSRIARVLVRSDLAAASAAPSGPLRRLVWAAAGAGALGAALLFSVENVALPWAVRAERPRAVTAALDALAWFERDDAGMRLWAARRIERAGDLAEALEQYERSFALAPDVPVLTDLVRIHYTRGTAPEKLAAACRHLFALLPEAERGPIARVGAHASFLDGAATTACYRSAGRWRQARADEMASAQRAPAPSAGSGLVLGY